jgi:hypothetical protein
MGNLVLRSHLALLLAILPLMVAVAAYFILKERSG